MGRKTPVWVLLWGYGKSAAKADAPRKGKGGGWEFLQQEENLQCCPCTHSPAQPKTNSAP